MVFSVFGRKDENGIHESYRKPEEIHTPTDYNSIFDRESEPLIEIIGGEETEVAKYLSSNGGGTDEEISEEIGMNLNRVRRALSRLYEYRLAYYTRTTEEGSGWYIYNWNLDIEKLRKVIASQKEPILEKLRKSLEVKRETSLFSCEEHYSETPFVEAIDYKFKCPQCTDPMNAIEEQPIIKKLNEEISKLEDEIKGTV